MQIINSSTHLAANAGVNRTASNSENDVAFDAARSLEHRDNRARRDAINPDEKSNQTTAKQEQQNFELNDSKLAIIEKHQASEHNFHAGNTQLASNSNSASFAQTNQGSYKEQVSSQNHIAVSTYSAVNNIAQRESVQKLFGVDLFA
ncbi:hypothetical protein GCM10009111_13030 [Colwellia asteriadis]|uniref:Uncharacterized protein n=1 Tax=Colwellia asteriadis TaxID=517723 RepID=A0ABN1L5I1_9GAMM